jgi:hypothetical protein
MSNSNRDPKALLDELSNFMAEQAETMLDDELLEEAAETGESAQVENLKWMMAQRAEKVAARRLASAREGYQAAMAAQALRNRPTPPPFVVLKRRVRELFTREADLPLAAAWRNGEYQSESDLQGLWYELYDLGVITDGSE